MDDTHAAENSFEKAWKYAERFLTQQPRTSGQVRRKLSQRSYNEEIIEQVVAELKDSGFLDDRKYAEDYINNSVFYRPMGRIMLKQKLAQRLLHPDVIESTMQEFFTEDQERKALLTAFEKKDALLKNEKDPKKKKEKLGRYLASRGFPAGLILEIINN
ncbi:regulatory protein RecX [Patescibacteria group bacterium]